MAQDECAAITEKGLPRLGDGVERTLGGLGDLLSLMECIGACRWGCAGGSHVLEHQVARAASFGLSSCRLMLFGHYDESLALTRSIAETGNLMMLFYMRPEEIQRWLNFSPSRRPREFGPARVRIELEKLEMKPPTNEGHYRLLCGVGVHPTPDTQTQAYGEIPVPTMGGRPQERAQRVCINELAHSVATVGGPAVKLMPIPRERAESVVDATIRLLEGLGEVRIWSLADADGVPTTRRGNRRR